MHIFRWDLDRTYLDTDIHSVRGLIRTAWESASDKRTLPGAASLLRALVAHDPTSRVHVLSGSPKEMRSVLLEKLQLDGVRVDSLVLKDNLENLRRGRWKAVRGQVGYKLPRLIEGRKGLGPAVRETLFGDDSEADALVYTAYAEAIAGRLSAPELARLLEAGGAYPDSIEAALEALQGVGRADSVEDAFIRIDRGVPVSAFEHLGGRITPVFSWWQASLVLWQRERIGADQVVAVAESCRAEADLDDEALGGLLQDALRRRLVTRAAAERVAALPGIVALGSALRRGISRLGDEPSRPSFGPIDFPAFLRAMRGS